MAWLRVLEPYEFRVTEELSRRYLDALEDYHPCFLAGTPSKPPLVHPGLILNQSNVTRSPTYSVGPDEAGIHAKEETWFVQPARLGDRLRVEWRFEESYERRGRTYTVTGAIVKDTAGNVILRRRSHSTRTSRTHPIPSRREEPSGEGASLAQRAAGTGAGSLSEIGLVLVGRPKRVTLQHMRLFSGWPNKNIHTDEEVARNAGLVAPIASATQNMGHICEFMIDYFGVGWLSNGYLQLAFVRPIYPDYVVTVKGKIVRREQAGNEVRYGLDIWAETESGVVVTVGSAQATMRVE